MSVRSEQPLVARWISGVFTFVLVAWLPATAAAETWIRIQPIGAPSDRSAPAVASVRGSIYLFGGVKDDFETNEAENLDDLYRFDPVLETFEQVEPAGVRPGPRAFASSAGMDLWRVFYLYGGAELTSLFGFEPLDDFWVFDETSGEWRQIDRAVNPGPRSGATMWIAGSRLYLFGGITALPHFPFFKTLNDLWVFDLIHEVWAQLTVDGDPDAPPARHVAEAGDRRTLGGLLLYGGEGFDPSTFAFPILNDTWEYHLLVGRWRELTPDRPFNIDPPRNYGASALIGPRLYLQGGDIPGGQAGCGAPFEQNLTDELWRFDRLRRRWTQLDPSGNPLPRLKRHAAASLLGQMYVFSGWDFVCEDDVGPGQVWNRDVFKLDIRGD